MSAPRQRILVIDDDPLLHEAVRLILGPEGYEVQGALTGPAGVEAMSADPPSLVLLDIMLATPSEGLDLAYEMRKNPRLRSVPVIVLSAVARSLEFDFARQMGDRRLPVERILEKPFTAQGLRDAVRSLLLPSEVHP
ncbi:MAG: response regulator [Phycisphaerae bacterium]|jgi:CheY-like chemotaxis protein